MAQELKSVYIDRTGDWARSGNDTGSFYLKSEVDAVLAEKDAAIARLKDKLQAAEKQTENLINGASSLMFKQDTANDKLNAEIAELKAKLENVQASAYAESVDAGMRERRLRKALWHARAEWALTEAERYRTLENGWRMFRGDYEKAEEYSNLATKWDNVERKCRAKAKEYK